MTKCPQCEIDLDNSSACVKCGWQAAPQPKGPSAERKDQGPESPPRQTRAEPQKAPGQAGDGAACEPPVERNLEAPAQALPQVYAGENKEKPNVEGAAPTQSPAAAAVVPDGAQPKPEPQKSAASPNQPPAEKKDAGDKRQDAVRPMAQAEVIVEGSEVDGVLVSKGDHAILAKELIQLYVNQLPAKEQSRKEDKRSIIQATRALSQNIPPFFSEDLSLYLESLKEERLILISCPDREIRLATANALVEELHLAEDEQKRVLNFDWNDGENANLNIYFFLKEETVTEKKTAIIVDTISDKAGAFLYSLIVAGASSSMSLADGLRDKELLMICLVDAGYVEKVVSDSKREVMLDEDSMFTHWRVPFLQPLLKQYFPAQYRELEEQILRQRREQPDSWSQDDRDFCAEIKRLLKSKRLLEKLQKPEAQPEPVPASTIFKGNDPLPDTVAYVGTFFPDLSPQEFIRVVCLLLGNRTKVTLTRAEKTNEAGETVQVDIQKEIPLVQIWQESQDTILDQCHLVTVIKNSARAVAFDNHRLRDDLKEHLERKNALYLEGQFQCVQNMGLLFDPSDKIAENVMRLVIEMAAFSADDFLRDWLLEVINELERPQDAEDTMSGAAENSVFRCLKESDFVKAKGKVYQRISELLRKVLEEERLQGVVDSLMQGLIGARLHGSVLELVRRMKFAPGFDEFKWLRQLLDQGDEAAREQTYEYIFFSVKEMGVRGYQALESLESWLPKADRPTRSYSYSNLHALRLLLDLGSETLENFDPRNYGAWPTAYSLLAFKDVETATRYLKLLTHWLFHAGMKHAFSDFGIEVDSNSLNSALIAEWDFILLAPRETVSGGKNGSAARAAQAPVDEKSSPPVAGIDALTVRNILLEQVLAASDPSQQRAMLEYWNDLKDRMLMLSNILCTSPTNKQYKDTIWKRRLIKDLIVDFRALQKQTISVRQKPINV